MGRLCNKSGRSLISTLTRIPLCQDTEISLVVKILVFMDCWLHIEMPKNLLRQWLSWISSLIWLKISRNRVNIGILAFQQLALSRISADIFLIFNVVLVFHFCDQNCVSGKMFTAGFARNLQDMWGIALNSQESYEKGKFSCHVCHKLGIYQAILINSKDSWRAVETWIPREDIKNEEFEFACHG